MQLVLSRSLPGRRGTLARIAVAPVVSIFLFLAVAIPASAGTLDRIRETGTVKLGYVTSARPFSYQDESGKPAGYTVALCERISEAMKSEFGLPDLRTEFVALDFAARFDAVRDGKVDLLCAAGPVTLALREQVSFSIPVFPGGIGALMRKDAPRSMRKILGGNPEPERPVWRASLGQILQQRTFAVRAGSATAAWLGEKINDLGILAKIDPVEELDTGVDRVLARRADVLFGEREILLDAAKRSPSADDLMVLDRQFTAQSMAFSMARGDEDFRLLVDRVLSRVYRSGEIVGIYSIYFGDPGRDTRRFFQTSELGE